MDKEERQKRIVRKQESFIRRKNTMREPQGGQLGSLLSKINAVKQVSVAKDELGGWGHPSTTSLN